MKKSKKCFPYLVIIVILDRSQYIGISASIHKSTDSLNEKRLSSTKSLWLMWVGKKSSLKRFSHVHIPTIDSHMDILGFSPQVQKACISAADASFCLLIQSNVETVYLETASNPTGKVLSPKSALLQRHPQHRSVCDQPTTNQIPMAPSVVVSLLLLLLLCQLD